MIPYLKKTIFKPGKKYNLNSSTGGILNLYEDESNPKDNYVWKTNFEREIIMLGHVGRGFVLTSQIKKGNEDQMSRDLQGHGIWASWPADQGCSAGLIF